MSTGSNGKLGVLLVGPLAPPPGGVETVTQCLLDSDLKDRYDIVHCDITKQRPKAKCGRFDFGNTYWAFRHFARFWRLARQHRPAIIYMPICSTRSGFLRDSVFIRMAKWFGAKVVGHVHGGRIHLLATVAPPPLPWWTRRTLRKVDVLIALSESWRETLSPIAPGVRIEVIHNAVGEDFYQRVHGVGTNGRNGTRVLFVGSLGKRKGLLDIMNAAPKVLAKAPDCHFVLVGGEEFQGQLKQIMELHQQLGLGDAVEFTGPLYDQDKADQYLKSDLLILPSYAEGLPCVILEAYAAGLPVISTPVGGIPEVVEEGVNGYLIEPGDVDALADRIIRLCTDPALRAKMGEANREKVTRFLRFHHVVAKLDSIFASLVSSDRQEVRR